ncbi:TetR family transcriptional regulator [Streptosporangium sp. NPDC051023]|uniref:TetR family transcriptional regulator n=1 Tax=Streptosporangium sp. NPDC051023 TaxID=3155410 RepID=UPI00344D7E22
MGQFGLRERKKQKTRLALIDAALDLFAEQGYEATTVDQIAAAADISPRTFFRYFATKEDVALSLPLDGQEVMLAELAARPPEEPPFTALGHAMRAVVTMLGEGDLADTTRFLKARELIENTPALFAGSMRRMMGNEQRLVAEIARREGVDHDDLLAHFVVALFTSVARTGFEQCRVTGVHAIDAIAHRLEAVLSLAEDSLRPGWDRPGTRPDAPARSGAPAPARPDARPGPAFQFIDGSSGQVAT